MIDNIELINNEYWMYPEEPFRLIRFTCDGERYLFGANSPYTSAGVVKSRGLTYKCPTEEMIESVLDEITEDFIEKE